MIPLFFVSIIPSTKRRGTWPCFGCHPGNESTKNTGKTAFERRSVWKKTNLEKVSGIVFCAFGLGFMESLREMSHEI